MKRKIKLIFTLIALLALVSCSSADKKEELVLEKQQVDTNKNLRAEKKVFKEKPLQTLLNEEDVELTRLEKTMYGVKVTSSVQHLFDGFLNGDSELAFEAIEKNQTNDEKPILQWQVELVRIQLLMQLGLEEEALEAVKVASELEKNQFYNNLNSLALYAEIHAKMGNYDEAEETAKSVLLTLEDWEFLTEYESKPNNIVDNTVKLTAQLRAYTTLAVIHNMKEDYEESLHWSTEAEKRFNGLFYVSNHGKYSDYINLTLDIYYERAQNLLLKATAKTALGYSEEEVENEFMQVQKFYELVDYKKGMADILLYKLEAYNKTGQLEKANKIGVDAYNYSTDNSLFDHMWRVEVIRGVTFKNLQMPEEAEKALRNANKIINDLSGTFSYNSSKKRFRVVQQDIFENLVKFDLGKEEYSQLFYDLESYNARLILDETDISLLRSNKNEKVLEDLQLLDMEIRALNFEINSTGDMKKPIKNFNKLIDKKEKLLKKMGKKDSRLVSYIVVKPDSLNEVQKKLKSDETIVYFLPMSQTQQIKYLKIEKKKAELIELNLIGKELRKYLKKLQDGLMLGNIDVISSKSKLDTQTIDNTVELLNTYLEVKEMFKMDKTYIIANNDLEFIPWGMLDINKQFSIIPNGSWLNYEGASYKFNNNRLVTGEKKKETIKIKGAKLLTDKKLTEKNLRKRVNNGIGVVHFTTKTDNEMIRVNSSETISKREIFTEPLPIALVVFANHNAELNKIEEGKDRIKIQDAFYANGTTAILSTLWLVEDEATEMFMKEFYKQVKKGNYSKGYLNARNLLKKKGYPASIYGSFILEGLDD